MTEPMPEHTRRRLGPDDKVPIAGANLRHGAAGFRREPFSPEQLRDLGYRLGLDRSHRHGMGHDWDVADIMAVFHEWTVDLNA